MELCVIVITKYNKTLHAQFYRNVVQLLQECKDCFMKNLYYKKPHQEENQIIIVIAFFVLIAKNKIIWILYIKVH